MRVFLQVHAFGVCDRRNVSIRVGTRPKACAYGFQLITLFFRYVIIRLCSSAFLIILS